MGHAKVRHDVSGHQNARYGSEPGCICPSHGPGKTSFDANSDRSPKFLVLPGFPRRTRVTTSTFSRRIFTSASSVDGEQVFTPNYCVQGGRSSSTDTHRGNPEAGVAGVLRREGGQVYFAEKVLRQAVRVAILGTAF